MKGDTVAAPGWRPVSEEQVTLAEIMTHAGYRTGLVTDVYHQMKPSTNFHRGFSQFNWIRSQEGDKYRSSRLISPESVEPFLHPSYPPDAIAYRRTRLKQYLASISDRRSEEDFFAPQVFREGMRLRTPIPRISSSSSTASTPTIPETRQRSTSSCTTPATALPS